MVYIRDVSGEGSLKTNSPGSGTSLCLVTSISVEYSKLAVSGLSGLSIVVDPVAEALITSIGFAAITSFKIKGDFCVYVFWPYLYWRV
jgi:hypothetical protein